MSLQCPQSSYRSRSPATAIAARHADLLPSGSGRSPVRISGLTDAVQELNSIRRGEGFDWGHGATSCAVWKGVPLHRVLERAGADTSKGRFVWFEGVDTLAKVRCNSKQRRKLRALLNMKAVGSIFVSTGSVRHIDSAGLGPRSSARHHTGLQHERHSPAS
jgi:hypothetical protein